MAEPADVIYYAVDAGTGRCCRCLELLTVSERAVGLTRLCSGCDKEIRASNTRKQEDTE